MCQKRILFGTSDARLIAVDAVTGRACPGFGKGGTVDLLEGLGPVPKGYVYPTSPPAVVNGVVVTGHWVADGMAAKGPGGVIRGFDAVTGALRWAWDPDRPDRSGLPPAGETYARATPNAWGVLSGDEALGLVYVPTGVGTPDYFAAHRTPLSDKYGSSIIALDAATGKLRWHFQTTRHDIWDYDVASQPVLVDLDTPKGKVPAMITPTKRAQLFVLDRRTGQPIDAVIEKPVPQGPAPQEWVSKTQPYTTGFPSLAGPDLRESDMWGLTPLDQLWCRIKFKQVRYEGQFTPQGIEPVLTYPGSAGGSNWGSATVDPDRGLLIVNTLYAAEVGRLIPRAENDRMKAAAARADADDKSGVPKGMRSGHGGQYTFVQPQDGTPYAFERSIFLSPLDALCQKPPYARLHVFDIKTRKLLWSKPFGTIEHSGPFGIETGLPIRMGVPTIGGSMASAGGLIFIGASQDRHFRAYDIASGKILWSFKLPTTGAATPMSYRSKKSGRQFVIIAAGGHPALKGPPVGRLYAFALPPK
jgi:membrane-bound PQQ-dependent dehydrogenase (glucose/quinate/shikimate family)